MNIISIMKVAIYSRIIDSDQHPAVQQLFDELSKKNIEIVISHPFYETIRIQSVL